MTTNTTTQQDIAEALIAKAWDNGTMSVHGDVYGEWTWDEAHIGWVADVEVDIVVTRSYDWYQPDDVECFGHAILTAPDGTVYEGVMVGFGYDIYVH